MRAVIIATGYKTGFSSLLHYRPTPLLQIADKPIIFHILDFLSELKIKNCDIILSHLPYMIEDSVQDGSRWGIHITYHLSRNPYTPFLILQPTTNSWGNENVMLICGDRLPKIEAESIKDTQKKPLLWMYPNNKWSGWGILPANMLADLPGTCTIETLPKRIQAHYSTAKATPFVSLDSLNELKQANHNFLLNANSDLQFPSTAYTIEPGIWISRGVNLHPTAKLKAPAFIGENCMIEENATIGPNAVVENHSIIGKNTRVENSLILQKSYVGEDLEIYNSIIDRNLIINLSLDAEFKTRDDFILGEISSPNIVKFPLNWLERCVAAMLFALLSPIYFFLKLTHSISKIQKLVLPASENSSEWKIFHLLSFESDHNLESSSIKMYFRRLPVLINVMRGEVHFIGVHPRSVRETEELPPEWKKLYLRSKVGLITLSNLDFGPHPTVDEFYASEVFYAINMGFWYDCKLFFRWLWMKITRELW